MTPAAMQAQGPVGAESVEFRFFRMFEGSMRHTILKHLGGFSDELMREVRTHSDERRLFQSLFRAPVQPVPCRMAMLPAGPRVYISGPMTGIADLNALAFNAEAARLLALGYQVENPADVVLPDGATWADFMRADIPRLLACSHIRMLDGWTMSKGARLEHHIAISLGLEVLTDCDLPCVRRSTPLSLPRRHHDLGADPHHLHPRRPVADAAG